MAPLDDSEEERERDGARNELEAALAELWREVLGVASVGVDDDFFALGGHSLLATTLASNISRLLGVEFRVRDVEEHPTIASQAEAIVRALTEHDTGGVVADALRETPASPPRSA